MAFAPKATPTSIAEAAGNKKNLVSDETYAELRYDYITKGQAKKTITTATQNGDASVVNFAELESNNNSINTESTGVLSVDKFAGRTTSGPTAAEMQAYTKAQESKKLGKAVATLHEQSAAIADDMTITDVSNNEFGNNFRPKPEPPSRNPRGKDRASWPEIQKKFHDHILPNELYDDGANEYELTAYQLTWFMLSEGDCEGPLNLVAARYQEPDATKHSVIIAQTSGTDEFYIEDLEFESILGGPGIIATSFNFSVRSPFQADLVDHIFKASQLLGIRNHNDIPMFLLINWNARNAVTGEGKQLTTSRCIPFRVINMALSYDDAGGVYEVNAARYQEHNLNTTYGSLQKDIKLQGVFVKDMVGELLTQSRTAFANTIDAVLLPDVYDVIMSRELAGLPLVTDDQRKKSDQAQNTMGDLDKAKSVKDAEAGPRVPVERAVEAANSSAVLKEISTKNYNKYSMYKTAKYTKGKSITSILRDILESTVLYQQMVTALKVNVDADEAQMERSDPEEIKRYVIGFDTETEILGYDTFRRVYACKRTFICRMRLDPSLAKDEPSTSQTPGISSARLTAMLDNGLIKKAYPFYWSGLNTEIRSLDFKFDNHWINAQTLYSKMGGVAKRTTGINADKILSEGPTGEAWDAVRDPFDKGIHEAQADIKKQDKIISDATQHDRRYSSGISDINAEKIKAANKEKKRLEARIATLEQQIGNEAAIALAIQKSQLQVVTENITSLDAADTLIRSGHKYYKENLRKFRGGQIFVGDLQATDAGAVLFPIPQIGSSIPKISSGMREDYDRGSNILSEIMAKHEGGDMIEIDLEIRGDPYWIPKNYHTPNEDSVSPVFQQPYLIVLASSINDYNNGGIFQVNERSSLNALYRIITVQNRFSGGEFVQSLKCYRDLTVEINPLIREPDAFVEVDDWGDDSGFM